MTNFRRLIHVTRSFTTVFRTVRHWTLILSQNIVSKLTSTLECLTSPVLMYQEARRVPRTGTNTTRPMYVSTMQNPDWSCLPKCVLSHWAEPSVNFMWESSLNSTQDSVDVLGLSRWCFSYTWRPHIMNTISVLNSSCGTYTDGIIKQKLVQTSSRAHPEFFSIGARSKAKEAWGLSTEKTWSSTSPYTFLEWCLLKHALIFSLFLVSLSEHLINVLF